MDDLTVRSVLEAGESEEVEFKESLHSTQSLAKTICSFANTSGGVILLGIRDDARPNGIEDAGRTQQRIASANQTISPTPLIHISTHELSSKTIIAVSVQQAPDSGYHTYDGAIYVRVGTTTRRLDGTSHLNYLRQRQILSFDETRRDESLDRVDESLVQRYLEARDQPDYLRSHGLKEFLKNRNLAGEDDSFYLKNAALLCFGTELEEVLPQAEMKLVQFSTDEPVDILQHKTRVLNAPSAIEQAFSFVRNALPTRIRIEGKTVRSERPIVPLTVIREAIVNAVAHRDYFSHDAIQISVFPNKVEITSPGGLPTGLTDELFGTISVKRNPLTYNILRDLGYVEGLGTGIPRIKNEMRKAGLSDPEFVFTRYVFRVTLPGKPGTREPIETVGDLSERQKRCIEHLRSHDRITAKEYMDLNDVSRPTAVDDLNELSEYDYIVRRGSGPNTHYKRGRRLG